MTAVLLLLLLFTVQEEEWKLAKDKNGIKVFTRKSASSALKDSKVEGEINATPEEIAGVLMDFPSYVEWVPTCIASETLKQVNENEVYYYSEYKAPWPVANRDLVILCKKEIGEDGSIVLQLSGAAEFIPEKSKKIRIPEFSGYWKLQPVSDSTTFATNQFHTDPGGKVPAWLANTSSVDNPFKTFSSLKERLQ